MTLNLAWMRARRLPRSIASYRSDSRFDRQIPAAEAQKPASFIHLNNDKASMSESDSHVVSVCQSGNAGPPRTLTIMLRKRMAVARLLEAQKSTRGID